MWLGAQLWKWEAGSPTPRSKYPWKWTQGPLYSIVQTRGPWSISLGNRIILPFPLTRTFGAWCLITIPSIQYIFGFHFVIDVLYVYLSFEFLLHLGNKKTWLWGYYWPRVAARANKTHERGMTISTTEPSCVVMSAPGVAAVGRRRIELHGCYAVADFVLGLASPGSFPCPENSPAYSLQFSARTGAGHYLAFGTEVCVCVCLARRGDSRVTSFFISDAEKMLEKNTTHDNSEKRTKFPR